MTNESLELASHKALGKNSFDHKQLQFIFSPKNICDQEASTFVTDLIGRAMGKRTNLSRKISKRDAHRMSTEEFSSYSEGCSGSTFRQQQKGRILAGLRALKAPSVT